MAEIHPQILSECEVGALPMWQDDEFAGEHCFLMHRLYTNRSGSLSSYQKREGDRTLNGPLINICYKSEILYPLAS